MNVIKDVIFEGNILKVINDSIAYLDTQGRVIWGEFFIETQAVYVLMMLTHSTYPWVRNNDDGIIRAVCY